MQHRFWAGAVLSLCLAGCGGSGDLDRGDAADIIEKNTFEPGVNFKSTWGEAKGLVECLNAKGFLQRKPSGYFFNMEDDQRLYSFIEVSSSPTDDEKVSLMFDIKSIVFDVDVTGITSLGSSEESNIKKVEYKAKMKFPDMDYTCFEAGVPVTGEQYLRKYDDGWRLANLKNGLN